jgi:lipoic acid synthetase
MNNPADEIQRKPDWFKRKIPSGPVYQKVRAILGRNKLNTVCREALCPNMGECFSGGTAVFLILGSCCTRNCGFCAVKHGKPEPVDPLEPQLVAEAAREMDLKYVVITSVTRDDLADGGAGHFAGTISAIRGLLPETKIEVLIPDLQGDRDALSKIINAGPDVLNHNLETVPRLYPDVRRGAVYKRSIDLLRQALCIDATFTTKSGLMLGLGEEAEEIEDTLQNLFEAGCSLLTLGQYLQPSPNHLPVKRFVSPDEFEKWKIKALEIGFAGVASGPLVRSSYHAEELEAVSKSRLRHESCVASLFKMLTY